MHPVSRARSVKHCCWNGDTVVKKTGFQPSWSWDCSGKGTQWAVQLKEPILLRGGKSLKKYSQTSSRSAGWGLVWLLRIVWLVRRLLRRWHLNWGSELCDQQAEGTQQAQRQIAWEVWGMACGSGKRGSGDEIREVMMSGHPHHGKEFGFILAWGKPLGDFEQRSDMGWWCLRITLKWSMWRTDDIWI